MPWCEVSSDDVEMPSYRQLGSHTGLYSMMPFMRLTSCMIAAWLSSVIRHEKTLPQSSRRLRFISCKAQAGV